MIGPFTICNLEKYILDSRYMHNSIWTNKIFNLELHAFLRSLYFFYTATVKCNFDRGGLQHLIGTFTAQQSKMSRLQNCRHTETGKFKMHPVFYMVCRGGPVLYIKNRGSLLLESQTNRDPLFHCLNNKRSRHLCIITLAYMVTQAYKVYSMQYTVQQLCTLIAPFTHLRCIF